MSKKTIKMSEDEKKYFLSFLKVSKLLNLEMVINEGDVFRGHVDHEGIFLISPKPEDMEYQYSSMAMTQANELCKRLTLIDSDKLDINLELKQLELDDTYIVENIVLKSGKTKITNRCQSFGQITNIPKKFKDPISYVFKMDKDSINIITKGLGAMNTPEMLLEGDSEGVRIVMKTIGGGELQHTVSDKLIIVDEDADIAENFKKVFALKSVIPLFKYRKDSMEVYLTSRGIMIIPLVVDGFEMDVYIFPES